MRDKTQEAIIVTALLRYDARQSRRKGYNPNALPLHLSALEKAGEYQHETGCPWPEALREYFCGRVLDACLKAVRDASA